MLVVAKLARPGQARSAGPAGPGGAQPSPARLAGPSQASEASLARLPSEGASRLASQTLSQARLS